MGKLSNVLNALAIGVGGVGEGYGKGLLTVAMRNRDEYHQQMRDERMAASRKAETAEDREWSREQKVEERGYQSEVRAEDRAWDKEKFALQEAGEEKRLRLAASLRPKGAGRATPTSENERLIAKFADANARMNGREKANDEDFMVGFEKVKGKDSATSTGIERTITDRTGKVWGVRDDGTKIDLGIDDAPASSKNSADKDPAAWELQEKIVEGELGRPGTAAEVAARFKKDPKEDSVSSVQMMSMVQQELQALRKNPQNMMTPEPELSKQALKNVKEKLALLSGDASEQGSGTSGSWGDSASENPQESVRDVEQPGVIDAPATSTKGDEPQAGVPRGEGSERSPYLASTEEEVQWAIENGGPGVWIQYKDQLFKTKGGT